MDEELGVIRIISASVGHVINHKVACGQILETRP